MGIFKGYVDELRPVLVDTLILAHVENGTTTIPDIERNVRATNIDLGDVDVRGRIKHLDRNGHLKVDNDRVQLTSDGREDLHKVIPWLQQISRVPTAAARSF